MPTYRTGTVERVVSEQDGIQVLEVRVDGEVRSAVLYPRYAPSAVPGDRVVVNTTAAELGLGSGGDDFVVWNLAHERHDAPSGGHVMKLRYTPAQSDVLAVESPESPHHDVMRDATSLDGMPVVAASLHSQLLPVVTGIRMRRPSTRIAYVMTDGGALELALSRTVARLRHLGWLAGTVTVGHALGGDLEAVSLHSGLLAARWVVDAEVAVVGMGPGVVGTRTTFGTTALEMGHVLDAAASLEGRPVACVRMSSGDARDRHAGLSHHARTALERVTRSRVDVPLPPAVAGEVGPHRIIEVPTDGILEALESARAEGLEGSHMGRGPTDDPLFFEAAGAAGIHAASLL